jgi:hypothetical protein
MRAVLPKSVAQLTGVLVTAIVAFGTDLDVVYAMPLGVFAGALAVFFVSVSEGEHALRNTDLLPARVRAFASNPDRR